MPDYFIFGGCLRSELELPELAPALARAPTWTLRLGELAPFDDSELLACTQGSASCRVQLARRDGTYRYSHSCSGEFEIAPDGRTITFAPAPGGSLDIARMDLVARVLLHCAEGGDVTWLHASAVAIARTAIAFLGPSGAGKSTLALALTRAGARHLCDDALPVHAAPTPTVSPSDHTARLCDDTRARLAATDPAIRRESDGKYVLTHAALHEDAAVSMAPVPLAAIYLLHPVTDAGTGGSAVHRQQLSRTAALPTLMPHLKLGLVVHPAAPARMLHRLGTIARAVPVFELRITRDWSRLDEVSRQLLSWHGLEAPVTSLAAATAR